MRIHLDVVASGQAPLTLTLDASGIGDAREQALSRGYTVLAVRSPRTWLSPPFMRGYAAGPGSAAAGSRIPVFIEQLRDLLTAGLSVIEALATLRQGSSSASQPVLLALESRLRAGNRLSEAFAQDPVFGELLVALVRASEHTSDLPAALSSYLDHERRSAEVRHRVASVVIYPVLLVCVAALVLMFLLFYVVPRFARVFEGMGDALPGSARLMLAWSQLLEAHGSAIYSIAAITSFVLVAAALTPSVRVGVTRKLLSSRGISSRLRVYFLARWYRAVGLLVKGGIPLPQALRLSLSVLPSSLASGGSEVERLVNEGRSPSAAYSAAGMATPVAEQLLRAGERTGDLGAVLQRIAAFHETEVTRNLEHAMRALEPVLMIGIGVGVGIVVVLMYLPIFELAAAIQ